MTQTSRKFATIADIMEQANLPQEISYEPVDVEEITPAEAKRRKKRHLCGKFWGSKIDPYTGKVKQVPFVCGDLKCDDCRAIKANELKGRIEAAILNGGDVVVSEGLDRDEASELVRDVGKEGCLRIPGDDDDGDTVFHLRTWADDDKESFTIEDLNQYDIDTLLKNKPRGRNMSGSLGKSNSVVVGGKNPTVKVEVVVGKASSEDMSKIMDKLIRVTDNFRPQDIKSLQSLIRQRTNLMKKFMRDANIPILLTYVVNESVDIKRVSWGP